MSLFLKEALIDERVTFLAIFFFGKLSRINSIVQLSKSTTISIIPDQVGPNKFCLQGIIYF